MRNRPEVPAELESVRVRHREVCDDKIRRPELKKFERGFAFGGHPYVVAVFRETAPQHQQNLLLVIYEALIEVRGVRRS
jgi:hypothetical protein